VSNLPDTAPTTHPALFHMTPHESEIPIRHPILSLPRTILPLAALFQPVLKHCLQSLLENDILLAVSGYVFHRPDWLKQSMHTASFNQVDLIYLE